MQLAPIRSGATLAMDEEADARLLDLAEHAAEPNPFYHPALLGAALTHLDPAGRVRLLTGEQDGRLLAALPLVRSPHYGRLPVATAANWVHPQCFLGAPLLRAGCEEQGWAQLLDQLDGDPHAGRFLHLSVQHRDGPVIAALLAVCRAQGRAIACVDGYERALLDSPLDAETYWQAQVRPKKRKELRRLVNRLDELGEVRHRHLDDLAALPAWTRDFLALESSGWKGRDATAIASDPATQAYLCAALEAARRAGMLDMLRIDVDGRAIAMLVNFRHGAGGFSYKIAIDEAFARFSPGVLIEIDNLHRVQGDPTLRWMDSCAMPGHAMIDRLWGERRRIGQYRVALRGQGASGLARAAAFSLAGAIEQGLRGYRGTPSP